ncbi:efflux RND transporter permease subunit [Escherichia coli]
MIAAVKDKLETLKSSLPEGVEIVTTYDRSQLIDRAIDNLSGKLLEEFIVVAVVCALFLCMCARRWWRLFRCRWGCVLLLLSCTSRD